MSPYTLPELAYDYAALEPHYSARILELHHQKHHATYVKGANDTLAQLAEARDNGDFARLPGLQKNLAFHLSGHALHCLFWKNMSPDGGGRPEDELAAALDESFGSYEGFQAQLTQAAITVQGSGWGALSFEPVGGRLIVEQIYDHQDNTATASIPLLVLDMWEHAYYLQYQNVRPDWAAAFWKIVHWPDVSQRFSQVRGLRI